MQHQGNNLGDGNSAEDATMDNPQPSPTLRSTEPLVQGAQRGTDAVQRLDGSGSGSSAGLKTESGRRRNAVPRDALKVAKCLVI